MKKMFAFLMIAALAAGSVSCTDPMDEEIKPLKKPEITTDGGGGGAGGGEDAPPPPGGGK